MELDSKEVRQVVLFEVSEKTCALEMERIKEIIPLVELFVLPGQPDILKGFLHLENTAIPVLDLDHLFNRLADDPGLYSHILVLKSAGQPLALLVHYADEILAVHPDAVLPISKKHSFNDCVQAEINQNGRTAYLLSLEKLLLHEEKERLAQLRAMEQARLDQLGGSQS